LPYNQVGDVCFGTEGGEGRVDERGENEVGNILHSLNLLFPLSHSITIKLAYLRGNVIKIVEDGVVGVGWGVVEVITTSRARNESGPALVVNMGKYGCLLLLHVLLAVDDYDAAVVLVYENT